MLPPPLAWQEDSILLNLEADEWMPSLEAASAKVIGAGCGETHLAHGPGVQGPEGEGGDDIVLEDRGGQPPPCSMGSCALSHRSATTACKNSTPEA